MIKAANANIAAAGANTIVIPGHNLPDQASATSNRAELMAYRDMLVAIREKVATLKRSGRSLDDTIAAKPTSEFDAKWGQFLISQRSSQGWSSKVSDAPSSQGSRLRFRVERNNSDVRGALAYVRALESASCRCPGEFVGGCDLPA